MTDRMTIPIAMVAILAFADVAAAPASGRTLTHDAPWHPTQASYASITAIPSHGGGYRATLTFEPGGSQGSYSGQVTLVTDRGRPITGARLALEATMPDVDSVRARRPVVAGEIGGGRYRVEGLRFDHAGWWNVRLEFRTATASDSLAFNLIR